MLLPVSLALLASSSYSNPSAPAPVLTPVSQILETYNDSLTSYQATAKTKVWDLRPLPSQRGVGIDGAMLVAPMLPMHLAGNPFENAWVGHDKQGDLRLDTGSYSPTEVDIALPATGFSWVVGRTYNARQTDSGGSAFDSDGPMGRNWALSSQPEIVLYDDATDTKDVIYLVYRADAYVEFDRAATNSNEYKGKNGAAGCIHKVAGSPETFEYTDQQGYVFTFLGFNTGSGGTAHHYDGQLWKVVDPNGSTAYVGDSSSVSTAISNGWDGSGRILYAYDSSDRRFTYTYSSVDSVTRLTQVKAETKTGGTWGSPSGPATVALVDYAYYATGDAALDLANGSSGDLKRATITQYLDDGATQRKERYYRYWKGTYNSSTNPGYPHALWYAYDFEGVRAADWADGGGLNDSIATANESTLKPYASGYFEYDSNHRVRGAWFNGQCGCTGSSGNGTFTFAYETNGSFSNTANYDQDWTRRTVIGKPDGSYLTQYFDEVGQALSSVVTDIVPTGGGAHAWATSILRDSTGCTTEIRMPDNATGYTHSTGTITPSSGAGLIYKFTRTGSGDLTGFVTKRIAKEGTGGTEYYQWTGIWDATTLTSTISDVKVVRPLFDTQHTFPRAVTSDTQYEETRYTNAYFASHLPPLMPESITTGLPAVTTANNGSNTSNTRAVHYKKDGFVDFVKNEDDTIDYFAYTNGQETTRIQDADTTGLSAPAGFSFTGTPLKRKTTTSYTAQGLPYAETDYALDATTREPQTYRSALADGRLIVLEFPHWTHAPAYYGPVQFRVMNQAGKAEASGVIALSSSGGPTSSFIDTGESDPLLAITVGTVAQMHTTIYDESGTRSMEDRAYFVLPGSGAGSSGANYDSTTYGYDDSGRRWREKEPSGTIRRTVFDAIGRPSEYWIGTNDHSFSGGESGGTDNMVKTRSIAYDSGAAGKNSHVSSVTEYVEGTTTGQRVTSYLDDWMGRHVVTLSPAAPYTLTLYDNKGRVTAVGKYSSSSGLDAGDDPTSLATNRLSLIETFYDEMGRAWKTGWHKIDQADGSDDDALTSVNWYDERGRVVKTRGEADVKHLYDRLGRETDEYQLAKDDDAVNTYGDVYDTTHHATLVGGDIVLEQYETRYDETKPDVLLSVAIQRKHKDYGGGETTGALDSDADGLPLKVTAANLKGRAQLTSYWYDMIGRQENEVRYGTFGAADFDRSGRSVPTSSSTALLTNTAYNTDGTVDAETDPSGIRTKYYYDALARRTKEIKNWDGTGSPAPSGSDTNVTVQYAYTNGLRTSMTAKMPSGGTDQVTTYIYGTTSGTPSAMKVSTGHLLRAVKYPDSTNAGTNQAYIDGTSDADVVSYAYNAQGQTTYQKDQSGTLLESVYDNSGRRTIQKATTLGSGIDGVVRRVETGYDGLGRTSSVVQYDAVSSGGATDGVAYTYDDWGNVATYAEDRDTAVSGGGNQYTTAYTWAKSAPTNARNTLRKTAMTMPGGSRSISYTYGSGSGLHDDDASRVTTVADGGTTLAQYDYMGAGTVAGTYLNEISCMSRVYDNSNVIADLDDFNRITTSRWTKDLSTDRDFYNVKLTYDLDSNITSAQDNVLGNYNGVGSRWDVKYSMDNVNRLTEAKEGTLSGGSITNTARDEQWTLSHTGNWDREKLDLNGDGDFVDANELDDTRTHNAVNELTARDTDSNGSANYSPTYDAAGSMTDDARDYKYVYDAWNRLRKVEHTGNSAVVAEYRYNGLNHRIAVLEDTNLDGSTSTGSGDIWFYDVFDERWRHLARYRDSDTDPKEDFVPHQAGASGRGESSYIDLIICRNRDETTSWTTASDAVLEKRIYLCQNWRADLSAMVDSTGMLKGWVKYSAYGTPYGFPPGDTDSDGACSVNERNQVQTWITNAVYDVRGDTDLDGDVDATDKSKVRTDYEGVTLGRGALSASTVAMRRGYAGYELLSGLVGNNWIARHRDLSSEVGRWLQRDKLEYADCMSLYAYVDGEVVGEEDPFGLQSHSSSSGEPGTGTGTGTGTGVIPVPGGGDYTDGGGMFDCSDKCLSTQECPPCKVCETGYGTQTGGTPTESKELKLLLMVTPTGSNPLGAPVKAGIKILRYIMHEQGMDSFHIKVCTYECTLHRCNLLWKQKRCDETSQSEWIPVPAPDITGWVSVFQHKRDKIIQDMKEQMEKVATEECKKKAKQ